jgi:hypothetical protein
MPLLAWATQGGRVSKSFDGRIYMLEDLAVAIVNDQTPR